MRRALALAACAALALPALAISSDAAPPLRKGVWLAGDLHVHTTYSHDAYGGPGDDNTDLDEAYTLGHSVENQFRIAGLRGLDFLAISDHNDVRSQDDPGWGTHGVLALPAYEHSLDGHAQMLGAEQILDHGDRSAAAVTAMADALRAAGGVFQANHPAGDAVDAAHLDWGYGLDVVPDTVEVWNINPAWQPPLPSGNSIDLAIDYWEQWLDGGHRIAATGGSDNHYVATTAVQGVGQPTTWVFARKATADAVLDALRAGRTFISHQPPAHAGPKVFLEADRRDDGVFEAMVGDVVPPGSRFRVRVQGAPGALLRLHTGRGQARPEVVVAGVDFTYEFSLGTGVRWVRAELFEPDGTEARRRACDPLVRSLGNHTTACRDRLNLIALTSPIYIGD